MGFENLLYRLYTHSLEKQLKHEVLPAHIGVILDGNRRWAKQMGEKSDTGHRRGAGKITEILSWAEELEISVVTLWMLSTDNLSRSGEELDKLFEIICQAVENLSLRQRWNMRLLGSMDLLPDQVRKRLETAVEKAPQDKPLTVNVAIGYGGREEITEAVQRLLKEKATQGFSLEQVADSITTKDIAEHMYTAGQPDPELVIRTSGEQRLSGFLLWQSAHSEFYFCEAYWPDFRKIDFLRALRDYSQRERRLGK